MRTARRLSFVVFLAIVFALQTARPQASALCSPSICPPWGTLTQSGCWWSGVAVCPWNGCNDFCGGRGGLSAFYCHLNGDTYQGWCACNDLYFCPICDLDPWDCDPQTPFNELNCACEGSPIIADLAGDGIALTDAAGGVWFDFTADGRPEQLSWTRFGTDDGFLVLDRNRDGVINNGTELFGTMSPQPDVDQRNGFLALAVYDSRAESGNEDGEIDRRDRVFADLRFWVDRNHDGRSQRRELITLDEAEVKRISLEYELSDRVDEFGNSFRLRARIFDQIRRTRWIWDVFLQVAPLTEQGHAR